jgi:gamma-glutamylcyclotransferase (GGCT)/AIG2-like uncharacterized protein YtfP
MPASRGALRIAIEGAMQATGQDTDCLFVYGTLMIASMHPMAARLAGESRVVGPATVAGRLYDFGAYPGAVTSDNLDERVHGLVVRLTYPKRTLPWLDGYEGASTDDFEPRAYRRVVVPVRLLSGRRIDAWMYCYRGDLSRARRLPSGHYRASKSLVRLRS